MSTSTIYFCIIVVFFTYALVMTVYDIYTSIFSTSLAEKRVAKRLKKL